MLNCRNDPTVKKPKKISEIIKKKNDALNQMVKELRYSLTPGPDDELVMDHLFDTLFGTYKRAFFSFLMFLFCANCIAQTANCSSMNAIYKGINETILTTQKTKFQSFFGGENFPLYNMVKGTVECVNRRADDSVNCIAKRLGYANEEKHMASKTLTGAWNIFNSSMGIVEGGWSNIGFCFMFQNHVMPIFRNLSYKNKPKVLDMLSKERSFYRDYNNYYIIMSTVHLYDETHDFLEHLLNVLKGWCHIGRMCAYFMSPMNLKENGSLEKQEKDQGFCHAHNGMWMISAPLIGYLWYRYHKYATHEIRRQETIYDVFQEALDNIELVQNSSREHLEAAEIVKRWRNKTHSLDIINNPLTKYSVILGALLVLSAAIWHGGKLYDPKFQSLALTGVLHTFLFKNLIGYTNAFRNTRYKWQDLRKLVKILHTPHRPSKPNVTPFIPYETDPGEIDINIPCFRYKTAKPYEELSYADTK